MNLHRFLAILLVLVLSVSLSQFNPQTEASENVVIAEKGAYFGACMQAFRNSEEIWYCGPRGQVGEAINDFEAEVGKKLAIVHLYDSWDPTEIWSHCTVYNCLSQILHTVVARGGIPMVSWQPVKRNMTTIRLDIPIRLQEVIDGQYDGFVLDWARAAKSFDHPIFIEFMTFFTLKEYPWSGPRSFGKFGNVSWERAGNLYTYYGDPRKADGPERFVDAWRHVHDIFRQVGADNVIWVWATSVGNNPDESWNDPENYYPGDEYVDWVGSHVYNWGYDQDLQSGEVHANWKTFSWLFNNLNPSKVYSKHLSKPFMITEISSAAGRAPGVPAYGDKAQWITDAMSRIKNELPNVKAVVWYSGFEDYDPADPTCSRCQDYRLTYPPEVEKAFIDGIGDPYFLGHIPFGYRSTTSTPIATASIKQGETTNLPVTETLSQLTLVSSEGVIPNSAILATAIAGVGIAVSVMILRKKQSKRSRGEESDLE